MNTQSGFASLIGPNKSIKPVYGSNMEIIWDGSKTHKKVFITKVWNSSESKGPCESNKNNKAYLSATSTGIYRIEAIISGYCSSNCKSWSSNANTLVAIENDTQVLEYSILPLRGINNSYNTSIYWVGKLNKGDKVYMTLNWTGTQVFLFAESIYFSMATVTNNPSFTFVKGNSGTKSLTLNTGNTILNEYWKAYTLYNTTTDGKSVTAPNDGTFRIHFQMIYKCTSGCTSSSWVELMNNGTKLNQSLLTINNNSNFSTINVSWVGRLKKGEKVNVNINNKSSSISLNINNMSISISSV